MQTLGHGRERAFIHQLLIRLEWHLFPQGEEFPSLLKTVDSATPGKPFVQNDIRVRDEFLKGILQFKAYVQNETRVRGEY